MTEEPKGEISRQWEKVLQKTALTKLTIVELGRLVLAAKFGVSPDHLDMEQTLGHYAPAIVNDICSKFPDRVIDVSFHMKVKDLLHQLGGEDVLEKVVQKE